MSTELPETGSAKLIRSHMFNEIEDDIDVPDGDIEYGKKLYNELCAGYQSMHLVATTILGLDPA
jgi:hypothetical protein